MFQVTFSNQSMNEVNKLDKLEQLDLIGVFSSLTAEQLAHPKGDLNAFNRAGKTVYRMRVGDWRIYFERVGDDILHALFLMHKHSIMDFIYRSKLPFNEEAVLEKDDNFWKYLETLKK